VNAFVRSVSGKNLSIRAIGLLANGYFRGPEALREQIKNGNITWALGRLKESHTTPSGCNQMESAMIRDLEILSKYMQRVTAKTKNPQYKTNGFFAQANLLTGGILRQTDSFLKAIRAFHDRTGQA
jgi:hypothetical protein